MLEKNNETYFTFIIILIIVLVFFIAFTSLLIYLFKKNRALFIEKITAEYNSREEERQRISKDLHDEFGALLCSTKMYLSTVNSSKVDQEIILKSISSISNGLDILHRITNNLYPSALNNNSLNDALVYLIHENCERINLIVKTNLNEVYLDTHLENRNKVQIYWILKEIIINTIKHAGAGFISIHFKITKQFIYIDTLDNGIGFDFNNKSKKGNGLANITNRVEILNGTIEIDTEINKGVNYQIKIPIKK